MLARRKTSGAEVEWGGTPVTRWCEAAGSQPMGNVTTESIQLIAHLGVAGP